MIFYKKIADILALIFLLSLALIIVEVFLRLIFPIQASSNPAYFAYEHHPLYGVALKPNISKQYTRSKINGGELINWKTNSLGFRGSELKKISKNRIIVYGDSNIQARFSNLVNTFPFQLENILSKYIKDVEVINAGLIGAGPDQYLLRMKNDIEKVREQVQNIL